MKPWLAVVLVMSGCATSSPKLIYLTPAEWETQVRLHGVDPGEVPNPLAVTAHMREVARRLAGTGTVTEQLDRLRQGLFVTTDTPFRYLSRATLTAAEAFYRHEGNCLSFTNLFVALGRSVGASLTTGLVLRIRGSERDGDLIVVNTHVVAYLDYGGRTATYDFDFFREGRPVSVRPLDDLWITALYLNNKGADALRAGQTREALRQFDNAVKLAPGFAAAWGNLGVARRRAGDNRGAFEAYERALAIEHDNPTVLTNVAALYRSLGKEREAALALAAGNLDKASPHVLIIRGDLQLAQGHAKEALELYNRARHAAPRLPDAWVAKAKAEIALGRLSSARRSLSRAISISPGDRAARDALDQLHQAEADR
ncbi:MAG: tetratricopeptide repeat protein [Acidobacteriota bacterium]